jgi:hypothetical protein
MAAMLAWCARTEEADLESAQRVAGEVAIDVVATKIDADDGQGEADGAHDVDEEGEEREACASSPGVVSRRHIAKHCPYVLITRHTTTGG